jgi:hypothetical protein
MAMQTPTFLSNTSERLQSQLAFAVTHPHNHRSEVGLRFLENQKESGKKTEQLAVIYTKIIQKAYDTIIADQNSYLGSGSAAQRAVSPLPSSALGLQTNEEQLIYRSFLQKCQEMGLQQGQQQGGGFQSTGLNNQGGQYNQNNNTNSLSTNQNQYGNTSSTAYGNTTNGSYGNATNPQYNQSESGQNNIQIELPTQAELEAMNNRPQVSLWRPWSWFGY